jgi:hypothetical protein
MTVLAPAAPGFRERSKKARMMPRTVPKRPMKGALRLDLEPQLRRPARPARAHAPVEPRDGGGERDRRRDR